MLCPMIAVISNGKKPNDLPGVRKRTIPTGTPPLDFCYQLSRIGVFRVACATVPHGHYLHFLDRSRYFSFQAAVLLSSWVWVDPVLNPLLVRKSNCAMNRSRDLWNCSQELWPLDHRGVILKGHNMLGFRPHLKTGIIWYLEYGAIENVQKSTNCVCL
jgi:hypothetical protein